MNKLSSLLLLALLAACATPQPPKPLHELSMAERVKARAEALAAQKKAWRAEHVDGKNPHGTLTTFAGETYTVTQFGTPEGIAEYYVKPYREGFRYLSEVREVRDNGEHYLIVLKNGETVPSTEKNKGPFSRYNPRTDTMDRFSEFEFLGQATAGGETLPTRVPVDAVKIIRITGE